MEKETAECTPFAGDVEKKLTTFKRKDAADAAFRIPELDNIPDGPSRPNKGEALEMAE